MPGEHEIDACALQAFNAVPRVVDDIALAPRARHRQQMVVEHEDPQALGVRGGELLLDPAISSATDLAVVEVGLGRVDGNDRHAVVPEHRVAGAEHVLEVDVADVARVVVARDHDHRVAPDLVHVGLRLRILVLEAEGGQVARADDDVRVELVDLVDGPLEQVRDEVRPSAVNVGDVRDGQRVAAVRAIHFPKV